MNKKEVIAIAVPKVVRVACYGAKADTKYNEELRKRAVEIAAIEYGEDIKTWKTPAIQVISDDFMKIAEYVLQCEAASYRLAILDGVTAIGNLMPLGNGHPLMYIKELEKLLTNGLIPESKNLNDE